MLLGINIENQLKFAKHVLEIRTEAGRNFSTLAQMLKLISFRRWRTSLKICIESKFKYCPLIWMFDNCSTNNRVNRLHELPLHVKYCTMNYNLNLKNFFLLKTNNLLFIRGTLKGFFMKHTRFWITNLPNIYGDLFIRNNHNVNLRSKPGLKIPLINRKTR